MSKKRRKRRRGIPRGYIYIGVAIFTIAITAGLAINIIKYTPTKERVNLEEYFDISKENQAAVLLNDEYRTVEDGHPYAIYENNNVYLELNFVKDNLDDGYVYDSSEITLRYATDSQVYTATVGSSDYAIDKSNESLGYNVVLSQDDAVYIAADYMKMLTDFQYTYFENPSRVLIETAGYEKTVASTKGKTQIRKLNGPKSPIVEDLTKGEKINVIRDTGKWSYVISENGMMGYMRNNRIGSKETVTVEKQLADRVYNHLLTGQKVSLAWHQVTTSAANGDIAGVLASVGNVNVMSPTWFYMNDNKGGIASIASNSYVNYCHENNIQVWALISNLEDSSVDTTAVLNTTSSRDNLVNNLIAQAITYGLDGINIDIEELSASAADGYIEFIKELSIKCEKNDIILSVDNYVPSPSSGCYNREEQAKYADYVIIMGYDEHYGSSEEAGSVASLPWVKQGVQDTLAEVPAEQVILGMPFYCRVWEIDPEGMVSSKAYGMGAIQSYMATHNAAATWDESMGQYYAEFVEGNTTYKIWVEDPTSLEEKLKVMDQYSLAGAAYWKLGFDNDNTWKAIAKYF